jgi:outer membrane lipoprotein-sorting protein
MEPEDIDNFNYTVLRSERLKHDSQEYDCYVIEAIPANEEKKRESGYAKRILWIEKKRLITLKGEFYDRREKLQKTQTATNSRTSPGRSGGPRRPSWTTRKSHKTLTGLNVAVSTRR